MASPTRSRARHWPRFPNVDGVVALTHGSGCGMDVQGESMQVLRRTLGGYARHANFAGVLIVGLGCEANQINALLGAESLQEGPLLRTFSIQDTGGTGEVDREGRRDGRGDAAARERRGARARSGEPPRARPAVRRLGRLLGNHGESRAGRGGRPDW